MKLKIRKITKQWIKEPREKNNKILKVLVKLKLRKYLKTLISINYLIGK